MGHLRIHNEPLITPQGRYRRNLYSFNGWLYFIGRTDEQFN